MARTIERKWERITDDGLAALGNELVVKETAADVGGDAGVRVLKADEEHRYTLGLAYAANTPDVGVAADGFRDFMAPGALEQTAWGYTAKSRNVGLVHVDGMDGKGTVVESYIYRGPDWSTEAADGSAQVIKAGDWLIGVVWDESAWGLIKSGVIKGFSPQGAAKRRAPSPESRAQLRRS